MRSIQEIQADIYNRRVSIADSTNEVKKSIWQNELNSFEGELKEAQEAQEAQERVQSQEAEIESITLPYDFEELFGEEDRPVPKLNEMIIEVVKDTKRQANIEKNLAIDELKAEHNGKIQLLQEQLDYQYDYGKKTNDQLINLQEEYANLSDDHFSKSELLDKANTAKAQAILERDDAYSKRDSVFRQLQEAQEIIKTLESRLENAPTAKQSLDISASDKLAKMVKESLAEKVNRGLARWDIPVLKVQEIEPVSEEEAPAEEVPFHPEEDLRAAAAGLADQSLSLSGEEEIEVITLESLHARVNELERAVYGKPQQAVA